LYFKIFLSSAVKIFSMSKGTYYGEVLENGKRPTSVHFLLFLELFLEIPQVVLEKPCLPSTFLLQHVELPLQIAILRLLVGYAFIQGSKFLVTTHNCFQFV
jgi:hypothetical protein